MGTSDTKNGEELRQPQKFVLVGLHLIMRKSRRAPLPASLHTLEYSKLKDMPKTVIRHKAEGLVT